MCCCEYTVAVRTHAQQLVGTWYPDSFQVFLTPQRPQLFEALGLYCIPHCGVYGDDYTPCGPVGVIGLPVASLECVLRAACAGWRVAEGTQPPWWTDDWPHMTVLRNRIDRGEWLQVPPPLCTLCL
jgi:hypothetical protein